MQLEVINNSQGISQAYKQAKDKVQKVESDVNTDVPPICIQI
jgi:hypothetical protein